MPSSKEPEIKDVYFRRFVVPIVLTILFLVGAAVIIVTPPGSAVKWDTFKTVFGSPVAQI
jgi:hypothetical protein